MELIEIKVAFIPPKGLESYAGRGDILMCLAQLASDPEYMKVMTDLGADMFTMIDNGANEGQTVTHEALAEAAERLQVNEVVLPDVLDNGPATIYEAKLYLQKYRRLGFDYMGVVQGTTVEDLEEAVRMYLPIKCVTTLGLPRRLMHTTASARINLANWIDKYYHGRFQIHFLGASTDWVKEPVWSKYAPHVRSIDTSLPFNYGLAGVMVTEEVKVDRPANYFTRVHEMNGRTTVLQNLAIYKEWCNGKKASTSQL